MSSIDLSLVRDFVNQHITALDRTLSGPEREAKIQEISQVAIQHFESQGTLEKREVELLVGEVLGESPEVDPASVAMALQVPRPGVEEHLRGQVDEAVAEEPVRSEAAMELEKARVFFQVAAKGDPLGAFLYDKMIPPNPASFRMVAKDAQAMIYDFELTYPKEMIAVVPSVDEPHGWKDVKGANIQTAPTIHGKFNFNHGVIEFEKGQLVGKKKVGLGPLSKTFNVSLTKVEYDQPTRGLIVTVEGGFGIGTQKVHWSADELTQTFQHIQWK